MGLAFFCGFLSIVPFVIVKAIILKFLCIKESYAYKFVVILRPRASSYVVYLHVRHVLSSYIEHSWADSLYSKPNR
jgi:hypothetical protein